MGVKINTPHYLVKLNGLKHGTHTYTVIVSQLETLSPIFYTMKVNERARRGERGSYYPLIPVRFTQLASLCFVLSHLCTLNPKK